jgi:hypothetical protein
MLLPIGSCEAEVDKARLGGIEPKLVPRKTLAQHVEDPPGVVVSLERQDSIVGEVDKGTSPFEPGLHLAFEPRIQHMVQEDVREQRRDDALNAKDNLRLLTPPIGLISAAPRYEVVWP